MVPPAAFSSGVAGTGADAAQAGDLAQWWRAWHDPVLDGLVEHALAANQDLRAARARVLAARAMAAVAESALYPTVAAHGAVWGTASDGSLDGKLGALLPSLTGSDGGTIGDGRVIGLGATWEPDVLGGRHADLAAARAGALASEDQAAAMRVLVVADVVENYQQWQGIQARLALLDRSLEEARALAAYAKARMQAGQATASDVSKAEANVQQLAAGRAPLLALAAVRRQRLAVLGGEVAKSEGEAPVWPTVALVVPDAPAGPLPSAVLARRPDVRAQLHAVDKAAAQWRSLKADLWPRFSIAFLGQNGRIALGGLPGYGGNGALLGLGMTAPVFNAGRLKARVAGGDAQLEAAMAARDQAVLSALGEVESAYALRQGLDAQERGLAQTLATTRRRAGEAEAFYRAGRMTWGEVLEARLAGLQAEDSLLQVTIARGSATVQLFRTLGGGWQE